MTRLWKRIAFHFFVILFVSPSIAFVLLVRSFVKKQNEITLKSLKVTAQAASDAANRIDENLSQILVTRKISENIEKNKTQKKDWKNELIQSLEINKNVTALVIVNAPEQSVDIEVINHTIDIYLAFQIRRRGMWYRVAYANDEIPFDLRQSLWLQYRSSLIQQQPVWSQRPTLRPSPFSFIQQKHRWWFGGFTMPYRVDTELNGGPRQVGVVAADITLNQIRRDIFSVISGILSVFPLEASYAFIVSKSGYILSHPDRNYVVEKRQLRNFALHLKSVKDLETELPAVDGTQIRLLDSYHDTTSGQDSWVFFAPIESEAGWWVAIVIDKYESRSSNRILRWVTQYQLAIVIVLLIALMALAALVFQVHLGHTPRLWLTSHAFAVLCMMTVISLWYISLTQRPLGGTNDIVLLNRAIAAKVGLAYTAKHGRALLQIPTGIYIQSIEFTSANDVIVSGYVWQKYDDSLPSWVKPKSSQAPGIILPEAESSDIDLVYHDAYDGGESFGWRFTAKLSQEFQYSRYPFDYEQVWLRLWHAQMGRGVALIPDFNAYNATRPELLPGLDQVDFVLEGWSVKRTFFSYRYNSYNTNFGQDNYVGQRAFPELYYNIDVSRNFLTAFIAQMIPLIVASSLCFGSLLMIRYDDKASEHTSFNASSTLSLCASLFFAIVVAHSSLRSALAAKQIIYLEYFYFTNYITLLTVSVNALLASLWRPKFIVYQNNLIMRLAYWPCYWIVLLLLTIVAFYM